MLVNRKSSFSRLFRWIFCNITRFLRVFFLLVDFQQSFCPKFSLPNNRFRTHGTVSNINSRTFDPHVKQRIRRLFSHTRTGGNVRSGAVSWSGENTKRSKRRFRLPPRREQRHYPFIYRPVYEPKTFQHTRNGGKHTLKIYTRASRARIYNKVDNFLHFATVTDMRQTEKGTMSSSVSETDLCGFPIRNLIRPRLSIRRPFPRWSRTKASHPRYRPIRRR